MTDSKERTLLDEMKDLNKRRADRISELRNNRLARKGEHAIALKKIDDELAELESHAPRKPRAKKTEKAKA